MPWDLLAPSLQERARKHFSEIILDVLAYCFAWCPFDFRALPFNHGFSDWRLSIAGSKGRIRSLLQDPSEAVRFGACSALGSMQACGFPRRSSWHAEESRELDDAADDEEDDDDDDGEVDDGD